jgi:hypothetical protein
LTPDNSELDTDFATGSEVGFAATSDSEAASSRLEDSDTETECGSARGEARLAARRAAFLSDANRPDTQSDLEFDAEGDITIMPAEVAHASPAALRRKRRSESKSFVEQRPVRHQDEESYGEASDEEGYAESSSSMLDSMMLTANDTSEKGDVRTSDSVAPFASEFDIPLHVDLFPERRAKLNNNHVAQRRGKTPFFEYLYG